jgi:hypothetical protein
VVQQLQQLLPRLRQLYLVLLLAIRLPIQQ